MSQNNNLEHSVNSVSKYICNSSFIKDASAKEWIDSVYLFTKNICDNDISETCFVLTFVTLPYNEMPLRIPYLGITVNIPLPSPDQETFNCKRSIIPDQLFYDSPNTNFGDKDKFAHFFGNAFFSYNFNWFNLTKFMSIFVEYFEGVFAVQGGYDIRDIKVNLLGEIFGKQLINNPDILPSEVLDLYLLLNSNLLLL